MIRRALAALIALAGTGRPDDMDALIPPSFLDESTPIYDAARADTFARAAFIDVQAEAFSDVLDHVESVDDLVWLMGGDA